MTAAVLLELARADGIAVVERPFSLAEAREAREAALSSTNRCALPVTTPIDERTVGNGHPGTVVRRLAALYDAHLQ